MLPNVEQNKSLIRWFLAWLSGIATGYVGAKGWLTADQLAQVGSFFSSETVVALIFGAGSAVWGLAAHTQKNAIAAAAASPGTEVDPRSGAILPIEPELVDAAKEAATPSMKSRKGR